MKFRNKYLAERDLDALKSMYGDHPELGAIGYSISEGADEIIQTIDVSNSDIFLINAPNIVYDGRMCEKYLLFVSRYYLCEFMGIFTNEVVVNSYDGTKPPTEVLTILKQALLQRETREGRFGDFCFAPPA